VKNKTTTITDDILNKKKEIEHLREALLSINKENEQVTASKNEINTEVTKAKGSLHKEQEELNTIKAALLELGIQSERVSREMRTSTTNLERLTKSFQTDKYTIEITKEKLSTLMGDKENQTILLEDLQSQVDSMRGEYNIVADSKLAANNELKTLKDTIKSEFEQVKVIEKSVLDSSKQRDDILRKKRETTTNLEMLTKSHEREKLAVEHAIVQLNALKETVDVLKLQNDEQKAILITSKMEHDKLVETKNSVSSQIQASNKSLAQEAEQIKGGEKILADTNKSLEKYRVSYKELTKLLQNKTNETEESIRTIESLKNKLEKMENEIIKHKSTIDTNNQSILACRKEYDEIMSEKTQTDQQLAEIKEIYNRQYPEPLIMNLYFLHRFI
jgi:chromosome segregation ATPase